MGPHGGPVRGLGGAGRGLVAGDPGVEEVGEL